VTSPTGQGFIAGLLYGRGSEKGSGGGRSGPGTLPSLPPLGAIPSLRRHAAGGDTGQPSSRAAAPGRRSFLARAGRAPAPLPLALDDPTQRLTARGAAKPLARTPLRGCERLVAARPVAAEKSTIVGWALTLAFRFDMLARDVQPRAVSRVPFGRSPTLGAATPVPPALVPALFLTGGCPSVLLAGPPSPPTTGRRTALGATIPDLGTGWPEERLAPFEQTTSLPRPTRPLTATRRATSLWWAQGSCELPTAKPRVRSPLCSAPRRLRSIVWPSWRIPCLYLTAGRSSFQAAPEAGHFAEIQQFRSGPHGPK